MALGRSLNHRSELFILSLYGWTYWLPIMLAGGLMTLTLVMILAAQPHGSSAIPWLATASAITALLTLAGLAFFRDFPRTVPDGPGLMVAPADGTINEIARIEHYVPLGGPVLKIGIFLSVLDVHVNRTPCAGIVIEKKYQEGLFLDARDPLCSQKNQSATIVLAASKEDPRPIAAVKQLAGAIARRIVAPVEPGDELKRGERYGMIAFGSRTELYVPNADKWEIAVQLGAHVKGGADVLLYERASTEISAVNSP